ASKSVYRSVLGRRYPSSTVAAGEKLSFIIFLQRNLTAFSSNSFSSSPLRTPKLSRETKGIFVAKSPDRWQFIRTNLLPAQQQHRVEAVGSEIRGGRSCGARINRKPSKTTKAKRRCRKERLRPTTGLETLSPLTEKASS